MNTGNRFGGDPAIGAWVTYGLGSENQDLPGYIVLPGSRLSSRRIGQLVQRLFATVLSRNDAARDGFTDPRFVPAERNLAQAHAAKPRLTRRRLNEQHAGQHPRHDELCGANAKLRDDVSHADASPGYPRHRSRNRDDPATCTGIGDPLTEDFGRRCLLARRLVEKGVRFVQVYTAGWDSHDYIERAHSQRIRSIDKPMTRADPGPQTARHAR